MSNQNNKNNNNKSNDNNNNNFFNDNPMLAFGIFALVMIILFKSLVSDDGLNNIMGDPKIATTKKVNYSDIKRFVKEDKVQSVKITSSTIEAVGTSGNIKYIAQNVPAFDEQLIPLMEDRNITYEGRIGEGLMSELIGMLLPIFIFFGIW